MAFCRESLRLQLVRELPELVEIDTRPEPEGMGNRLWCGTMPGGSGLADARANCSVHRFLKRNAKLSRALLQQSRKVIVER